MLDRKTSMGNDQKEQDKKKRKLSSNQREQLVTIAQLRLGRMLERHITRGRNEDRVPE